MIIYRILKHGETILPGDEFFDDRDNVWRVRDSTHNEKLMLATEPNGFHLPHRRKVEYPEHTPPAPPEGMRWEYRGEAWSSKGEKTTYYFLDAQRKRDINQTQNSIAVGFEGIHYFEAVPDFANMTLEESLHGKNPEWTWMNIASENPKESAGRKKCPMHLLSPSAMRETANALGHGAEKYQARNYRTAGVNATTYVGAILRHISAWNDGEDLDPESGLSHIAHVAACADILLDTMACGMMNDDRSKRP